MKRVLLLMVATMACSAIFAQVDQGGDGRGNTPPPPPDGLPLSLEASVDVELDLEMGVIRLVFHDDIGEVAILITSESGAVVGNTIFDSSSQWLVELEAPEQSGYYTLWISSATYEASSPFWVP